MNLAQTWQFQKPSQRRKNLCLIFVEGRKDWSPVEQDATDTYPSSDQVNSASGQSGPTPNALG
jgi:hypothetical protein